MPVTHFLTSHPDTQHPQADRTAARRLSVSPQHAFESHSPPGIGGPGRGAQSTCSTAMTGHRASMNLLQVGTVTRSRPCSRCSRMALAAALTCPTTRGAAATSSHVPVTLHARSGKLLQSVPLPPEVLFPQHHLTFCSQPVFPPLMVSLFIFKVHFSIEQICSLWKYSYYNYHIIPTPYMKNLV